MRDKSIIRISDIKKGHKTQRERYGDGYGEEMARRQKLSYQRQLEKYGGEDGLKAEMSRRAKQRKPKEFQDVPQ